MSYTRSHVPISALLRGYCIALKGLGDNSSIHYLKFSVKLGEIKLRVQKENLIAVVKVRSGMYVKLC